MGKPGEAPGDGTWGSAGTRQIRFPQGANHQLSSKREGWLGNCLPCRSLQLELNLNSFAGKPPGAFLSIAGTDS